MLPIWLFSTDNYISSPAAVYMLPLISFCLVKICSIWRNRSDIFSSYLACDRSLAVKRQAWHAEWHGGGTAVARSAPLSVVLLLPNSLFSKRTETVPVHITELIRREGDGYLSLTRPSLLLLLTYDLLFVCYLLIIRKKGREE